MKKTALFTALIAAAGVASTAQAAPTVYGKVDASVQIDLAKDKPTKTNTVMDLKSHKARIGVKGDEAINDSTKGVYKIELNGNLIQLTGADATTGKDVTNDTVTMGTRYMGLEGGFGQVLIGAMGTVMDDSTKDVDLSNNIGGAIDSGNTGSRGKQIKYVSPDFSGVKVGVSLLPHGTSDTKGKKNGSFGFAGTVSYDNNGIYAALGFESGASSAYYEADGQKQPTGIRLVTQLNMIENVQLGFMYDSYKLDTAANNSILASASYDLGGITPRVQVTHLSHDSSNKATQLGLLLGANYALSENVSAYSDFGYTSEDSGASGSEAENSMALDFGLAVSF